MSIHRPIVIPKDLWLLIFLALNKYSPVEDYARIHLIFFLYDLLGFEFDYGPMGPYSREVENALIALQQRGFIKVIKQGTKRIYRLTDSGAREAYKVIYKIKNSYILLNNVLIVKGENVLRDLKKFKLSYGEKPLLYLLSKCLDRMKGGKPVNLKQNTTPLMNIFLTELSLELERLLKNKKL
ncbi:MAG: hypothetical protein DRJ51_03865 [Thermoprotei archaeon]|nr:MAG: hypothetical protein DRJ51_03865 [Thermoprotei archaeon]RLE82526.1 MAG: hypothetical protein DRJ36_00490 [Thermoprotei archaeon]RLF02165.1 MAG: hypothetical protein DRJ59_04310 [Thermoprotei archaeon]